MKSNENKETRVKNYALWTVQWLLALLFLWAGGVKLVLPLEMLKGPVAPPGLFVRFIGVAETLGAIGSILPWLLRIRPVLTPLAASGLVIIMIGATVITLIGGGGTFALIPTTVGILAASVAYSRARAVSYALNDFNHALRLAPRNADAYVARAKTCQVKGELAQALQDYNRALQLDPHYVDAYNNRGCLLAD